MESEHTFIRSQMRSVIDESKIKKDSSLVQPVVKDETSQILKEERIVFKDSLKEALSSLRAPKPRLHNQITTVVGLSSGDRVLSQLDKTDRTQSKLSARIHQPFKDFIDNFVPLVSKLPARGQGGRIHQLVDDYLALKTEEVAHLKEAMDFLRLCQNEEKEYLHHYGKGSQAEFDSKKKFETAISTLKLVLNLKRLSFAKLQRYKERGLVSQTFLDEVHYYLNPEVYEKWEQRGY